MNLEFPSSCLVVLIGASGSGKSTFARTHFAPSEVLSSDHYRGVVSNDPNSQDATNDAFEILHQVLHKRLARNLLTVVDATNVQKFARQSLLKVAKEHHVLSVAIVLDTPRATCEARNKTREDRNLMPHVVRNHIRHLRRSVGGLRKEGFHRTYVLKTEEDVQNATITRRPLWSDRNEDRGPFDIIGDVHGCLEELKELLTRMGYQEKEGWSHLEGRKAVFVGDLVDRGPDNPGVLRLVSSMVRRGYALAVSGNHDNKLMRKLQGRKVSLKHGLAETVEQLEAEPQEFREDMTSFLRSLVAHYTLDGGRLVVAHAGLPASMHGRASGAVRSFALYGETDGTRDEHGLPSRGDWWNRYQGEATVVFGHTPVESPVWVNKTLCIDTGCVFGGSLTALRYPERTLVQVQAKETYAPHVRPPRNMGPAPDPTREKGVLDLEDVTGRRHIATRLRGLITVEAENNTAALETMSRFAVDPRLLPYLPPTMSPAKTSHKEGYLEHPEDALHYFAQQEVTQVICEEKHMGSRAVILLFKDASASTRMTGISEGPGGTVYTRTGRPFFSDESLEKDLLERLRGAMERAGLWEELETDWICLDAELMPWSAKARELLKRQYAPVGSAAKASFEALQTELSIAQERGLEVQNLAEKTERRLENTRGYIAAYRNYVWPVEGLEGCKLAPFHIMATEGRTHLDKDHEWHMKTISRLCAQDDQLFQKTRYKIVDPQDEASRQEAIHWWLELTGQGGEGMVIKPLQWLPFGDNKVIQPAIKCRGQEYLRIIYGLDYTAPENLAVLRKRGLSRKRSMAMREFALGVEALERFVRREPLHRVHECVFGILALESEPVDPTL